MKEPSEEKKCRVLELFCGIGGLHWGLKVASVQCEVVSAMEINPIVLQTYKHNFPGANIVRKNLEGITASEINELDIDAIVMSPPCQPFCRTGNHLDTEDTRTGPLSHLTKILPELNFKYIFVENVQGFETSTARENLLAALNKLNFKWQEFLLTPKTLGIPNSRLRYYLLGKRQDLPWSFPPQEGHLMTEIPNWDNPDQMPFEKLKKSQETITHSRRKLWGAVNEGTSKLPPDKSYYVGDIIDLDLTPEAIDKLKVPDKVLHKYFQAMDIVTSMSSSSCCFTKGYGHFVKGTGSILNMNCDSNLKSQLELESNLSVDKMKLRYFSPNEISRLMCYPEEFKMPEELSLNQKYRCLGNSVNVYVVGILFTLLFS